MRRVEAHALIAAVPHPSATPTALDLQEPQASPNAENELVRRARDGDEDAFRRLVETYLPRVIGVAQEYVGRREDAEDVAQAVFFKIHRKLATFREDSAFFTWVYRITVNAASDLLKSRRRDRSRQTEEFERLPVADPADSPFSRLSRDDLRREIRDAMQEIPETFRTALILREFEGLAYEEIARTLRIAIGTVESRIFRARARLRVILERRLR